MTMRDTDLNFVVTPLGDFTDGVGYMPTPFFSQMFFETAIPGRMMEEAVDA